MDTLKVSQKATLVLSSLDSYGHATTDWASPPAWQPAPAGMVSLAVAADGLSAECTPIGPLGVCNIVIGANSDGVPKSLTYSLQITPGQVVSMSVAIGPASNI